MIAYILKFILCTSLFYLVYHFLLEKESMHRFKRFYLLGSVILSLVIPFITLPVADSSVTEVSHAIDDIGIILNPVQQVHYTPVQEAEYVLAESEDAADKWSVWQIVLFCSLVCTVILLGRYLLNFYKIRKSSLQHRIPVNYEDAKIALMNELNTSHSFWDTIFLNKNAYEKNKIDSKILTHELIHVRQKHTADVLFIEFLLTLFWFNPVLYLYRRAIKLNHEFLADEGVVRQSDQVLEYQTMLINEASGSQHILASNFNYLITKKRLIMMTKKTSGKKILICMLLVIPFTVFIACSFSKTKKQEEPNTETVENKEVAAAIPQTTNVSEGISSSEMEIVEKKGTPPPPPVLATKAGKGITSSEMGEYNKLIEKYKNTTTDNLTDKSLVKSELDKMGNLYDKMTEDQQKTVDQPPLRTSIQFTPPPLLATKAGKGITSSEMGEYNKLVEKYKNTTPDNLTDKSLVKSELDKMGNLYDKMTEDQQKTVDQPPLRISIQSPPPPLLAKKAGKGISDSEMEKYRKTVEKYKESDGSYKNISVNISDADRVWLRDTYAEMNAEQQNLQRIVVIPKFGPMKKKTPTEEEFESWKDADTYGVWIDGKKVDNTELSNYKNTDFSSVFVSRLYKNARKGKRYKFQVNIVTNSQYTLDLENHRAKKDPIFERKAEGEGDKYANYFLGD